MMNFVAKVISLGSEKNNTFFVLFPSSMEQSQLMELLRILLPSEREQVLQFATLSFINNGKLRGQVIPLLEICLNYLSGHPQQELGSNEVFATLFPGQNYVEGKLEKVRVEAHKIVRIFLTMQRYLREENEFQQTFDFSEEIRLRGLNTRYQKTLSKLQRLQEEIIWKNETYFHQQFLLENAIHEEECIHNRLKGDLNIPKTINALELHGHLNRLALLNRLLLQLKVAKIDVPDTIKTVLEEIYVPERCHEASASIRVNHKIFILLRATVVDNSDVRSLFDLLLLYEKDLSPENLREFYTYLRNLCVILFAEDAQNKEINVTLHELYKDNLKRGYLHYEGCLHSGTFLAVCNNAVWLKKFEWVLEFIETHKGEIIDENETHDFYRLNMANYLFGTGRFSECLDYIPDTSPSVVYLLQGKRLELKALYELKSDRFSYKLDNFKMFLARTSAKLLSENQRKIHVDFANFLHQLANSRPGDVNRSDILVKRIHEKKQAIDWRWLFEKANALKFRDAL